jgi:hypothetical protein
MANFALFLTGIGGGFLSGLLGVGGGIIIVPILILCFHLSPQLAAGTSVAIIFFTTTIGTFAHHLNKNIHWLTVLIVSLGSLIGVLAGAQVCKIISGFWLKKLFGLLLLGISLRLLIGK